MAEYVWNVDPATLAARNATAEHVRLLRAWTGDGPKLDERATRGELKDWTRSLLGEHDRLVAQVDELKRELARACEERDETLDALTAEREAHDADVAQLGDERDRARERCKAYADAIVNLGEAVAFAVRGDYVLLRLRGPRPEVVTVTNWEEDDNGGVHVDGGRAREVAQNDIDV